MSSQGSSSRAKIALVDAHPLTRRGVADLLSETSDLTVCGEFATAGEALANLDKLKPDLVITAINLPDKSGLEFIKDIVSASQPAPAVLVFSALDESFHAARVLRAGGRGYVMKTEPEKRLLNSIRLVLDNQIAVSDAVASKIFKAYAQNPAAPLEPNVANLTDREFQVFRLIGKGLNTREIAAQFHLSPKTVEIHRTKIKTKLKLKTAPELLRYAIRWHTAEPDF
jgi:DNA-binding NarL/FixJ family response regulator